MFETGVVRNATNVLRVVHQFLVHVSEKTRPANTRRTGEENAPDRMTRLIENLFDVFEDRVPLVFAIDDWKDKHTEIIVV